MAWMPRFLLRCLQLGWVLPSMACCILLFMIYLPINDLCPLKVITKLCASFAGLTNGTIKQPINPATNLTVCFCFRMMNTLHENVTEVDDSLMSVWFEL